MKTIFFIALVIMFISCKKESEPADPSLNNVVKATIVHSPGDTIKINAAGAKAKMGCSSLGGGTFVYGINEVNADIDMYFIYSSNSNCVDSPGTYDFTCEYRPDRTSQTTPIYTNYTASHPGNITFTVRNGHNAEGYFNAVCKYNTDSVTVQGTFKGYIQ